MATLVLPRRQTLLKACGLDADGVVRNTGGHIYEATCAAATDLGGRRPTFDEYLRAQDAHEEYQLFERCGVAATHKEINLAYDRHVPPHDDEPPFDDVADFLLDLKRREIKLFVVSRHPTDLLASWFQRHGLHQHIEHLQGNSKQKGVHIQEICSHLGVEPTETCYVGDMGGDMKAAIAASVVPIGITRMYETREVLIQAGAEHIVDHLSDLLPMIV